VARLFDSAECSKAIAAAREIQRKPSCVPIQFRIALLLNAISHATIAKIVTMTVSLRMSSITSQRRIARVRFGIARADLMGIDAVARE
jgi:hypothetical protein